MPVYLNTSQLDKRLQDLLHKLGPTGRGLLFKKVAVRMEYFVRDRTAKGQGPNGPLPPYKPSYIKRRKAAGLQTAFMDLKFTGEMLGGITQSIRKNGAVLYFKGDKAREKAFWIQAKTGFFNLNETEQAEIAAIIEDSLDE